MLKRDYTDKLYSIIVKRFSKEQPERTLTNNEMSVIWYDLYGRLCRGEKYEDLESFCNNVKLRTYENEKNIRGYA